MTREEYEKSLNYVVNGEQQPCEDAISRQAAIDAIYARYIGGKEAVDKAPANDHYAEGIDEAVCAVEDLQPVTPQQKMGHWIETAKEYYEAINEEGGGVNENTPYFTDDIACSECLAKFSVIDNETERFEYCPNCGAKMIEPQEGGDEVNEVLAKIRAEMHATAEMHEDGDYYLRDEWIDEIIDKYKAESEV